MNIVYRKKLLACCISSAAAIMGGHVFAQQSGPQAGGSVIEEVVVQGIKRSLQRAQDLKRDSVGVMDAISAEGLGKFPDTNIAESLQRIPGIAIDRSGGEGQFVTVRGFGPSFNTVLVNGRRIVSETGGREFSFDLYPAELISGAEIYKSGVASLQEGGIGATINLKTTRPLELDGDKILITGKGLYDENSGEKTPQAFGLWSKSFNDGKTGVLLSASYQERKSQSDFSSVGGWIPVAIDSVPLANVPNANPGNVDTAFLPRDHTYGRGEQTRERTNIQAVFQHDLSDTLRFTVDGFFNKFEVESEKIMMESFFGGPDFVSNVILNENGTVLEEDMASEVGNLVRLEDRPTETQAIGFNLDWSPTDELQTKVDLSYSKAEAPQSQGNGQAVIGFLDSGFHFLNTGSEAEVDWSGPVEQKLVDQDAYLSHVAQFGDQAGDGTNGASVEGEIFELKVDNIYTPSDGGLLSNIKFGASYSREEKTVDILRTDADIFCLFCGFTVDVPNEILRDWNPSGLLSGVSPNTFRQGVTFDLNEYVAWQSSPEALAARDVALGLTPGTSQATFDASPAGFGLRKQPDSYKVTEDIFSAYADMTFEGEVANMPWTINTGVRWIWTEDEAVGNQQRLTSLGQIGPTQFLPGFDAAGSGFQTESNDYMMLLPNFALTLNATDNLVLRFAVSETMSRPALDDLAPRFSFLDLRPGSLPATAGNVDLKPYTSTNLDASIEYYWGELNYVTLAVFKKEVQNFIVTENELVTIDGVAINTTVADPAINAATGEVTVNTARPTNSEVADVDGLEIAAQFMFDFLPGPLDGLGISGNATFLDSNAQIDANQSVNTLFAIPGLGDSKNVSLFYEKGPIEARVSWNSRDEFLEHLVNPKAGVEPVFTEKFEQVDFRLSYNVNENYSVFVEGTNITDEKIRKHGRYDEQFILYQNTGPRFALGFRAQF